MFDVKYDPDEPQNFLKNFRQREHMAQKELLHLFHDVSEGKLKMTQSQLSDIENGRKPLNLEKGDVMCKIFNCKIEEMINMKFLTPDDDDTDNAINLNLFSTQQLKTIQAAITRELEKREALL